MDIKEFSRRLGVSTATISHALNGKRPVKAATRQMVLEKMVEWNYTPNVNARRLVNSKTNLIAFSSEECDTLGDPYQIEMTRGFCRELRKRDYDLLLDLYHEKSSDQFASLRNRVRARAVDGTIIIGTTLERGDFAELAPPHCPCVYIDNRRHDPIPNVATAIVDCDRAYRELFQCLREIGRNRVALLARTEGDAQLDRWLEYVKEYGFAFNPESQLVYSEESTESARDAALALLLLPPRPDAIIARTDAQAQGVLKAARQLGIAVPGELSIIGHGDVHYSRDSEPPLATVSFDYRQLAVKAVERLFEMIDHPGGEPPEPTILHGRFLPRGSLL